MAVDLYQVAAKARAQRQGFELRAGNYSGKRRFAVSHGDFGMVTVCAGTMQDAIWAAAKHWKTDPRKAAFHQGCNVRKVSG